MKYIKTKDLDKYLNGRTYTTIYSNGSISGMKNMYYWDRAKEIIKSGSYYYAIWQ